MSEKEQYEMKRKTHFKMGKKCMNKIILTIIQ